MDTVKTSKVLQLLCYIVPILFILIGLPLALKLIEPNSSYGIRTSKTLESLDVWYSVNSAGGVSFIVAGALSMVVISLLQNHWNTNPAIKFIMSLLIPIVTILIAIGVVFIFWLR